MLHSMERWGEESFGSMYPTSLPNQIANPVIYKLVRVEGDGRLIPATDDEVMEVEDLLEEEKVEAPSIADGGRIEGRILNEESLSVETNIEYSEGKLQRENTKIDAEKLNARLECIGMMLQKVKQEEKLRLSSSSADQSSNHMVVESQCSDPHDKLSSTIVKLQMDHSLPEQDLSSPRSNARCINQLGRIGTCLKPTDNLEVGNISVSGSSYSGSMPDFTRIKGEICLDKQTVRELQDTFKATFGRETSVKDKTWLKRRIAVGLSNSCDVSTATTFIINDNVLVENKAKEAHFGMERSNNMNHNMVYDGYRDSHTVPTIQAGGQQVVSCKRLRKPKVDYDCKDEDACTQQSAAKRLRKPTRRYIEEISEAECRECDGRSLSSMQNHANLQSSPKSCVGPICNVNTGETVLVTRHDSFGGSLVQVPFVSRVRRGRPRECFMSIMQQCHPSTMEIEAGVVKQASSICVSRQDSKSGYGSQEDIVSPKHTQKQVVAKTNQEDNLLKFLEEQEKKQSLELESTDSSDVDSDCNGTLPTSRYGIRRKHHRPWTLGEVIKLVEGVSKYGAGRWSEIKKVAFSSSSYRTSVDLKDKWRNLLKASSAQGSNVRGMSNSRKPGSVPVPANILLRVRQLAEKHSQTEPDFSPGKFLGRSERRLPETISGYL